MKVGLKQIGQALLIAFVVAMHLQFVVAWIYFGCKIALSLWSRYIG